VDNASTVGTPEWLRAQSMPNLHSALGAEDPGGPRGDSGFADSLSNQPYFILRRA